MGAKAHEEKLNKRDIENEIKNEVFTGHKPIPLKIVNKVFKSICKITINIKDRVAYGTGFFFKLFRKN